MARSFAVLFAISWLGLAIQPCMAGAHADDSPQTGHAGHHPAPAAPAHDCPHCPPAPAGDPDCGGGVALDCDAVGVPALPSKDSVGQQWDAPAMVALPAQPLAWPSACSEPAWYPPARAQPPPRSLQQRFCSFLK